MNDQFSFFLCLSGVQWAIGLIGLMYGIVLIIRKTRSVYCLLFALSMWGFGVMRICPNLKPNPFINQIIIIIIEICVFAMLFLHRKAVKKGTPSN